MSQKIKTSARNRVSQGLRDWIASKGEQAIGCRVPPIRQLAKDHDASVNTVMSVLEELEKEGMVDRRPNRGAVIAKPVGDTLPSPQSSGRYVAVLGPTSASQADGWADHWGVRIRMSAEETILDSDAGEFFPFRIGAAKGDWADVVDRAVSQVRAMADDLAGVIAPTANLPVFQRLFDACDKLDVPVVSINRPGHTQTQNFVALDSAAFGNAVGRLCMELDLEHVLVLSHDLRFPSNAEKMFGILQAHWCAGRDPRYIHCIDCGGYTERFGYNAVLKHLENHGTPQLVIGLGDRLAVGALRACEAQGLGVPDDVRIIGGTGMIVTECTSPPLAVLAQPMQEMGRAAAEMLLEMIRTGERSVPGRFLPASLIPRASLGITPEQARRIADQSGVLIGPAPGSDDGLDTPLHTQPQSTPGSAPGSASQAMRAAEC